MVPDKPTSHIPVPTILESWLERFLTHTQAQCMNYVLASRPHTFACNTMSLLQFVLPPGLVNRVYMTEVPGTRYYMHPR